MTPSTSTSRFVLATAVHRGCSPTLSHCLRRRRRTCACLLLPRRDAPSSSCASPKSRPATRCLLRCQAQGPSQGTRGCRCWQGRRPRRQTPPPRLALLLHLPRATGPARVRLQRRLLRRLFLLRLPLPLRLCLPMNRLPRRRRRWQMHRRRRRWQTHRRHRRPRRHRRHRRPSPPLRRRSLGTAAVSELYGAAVPYACRLERAPSPLAVQGRTRPLCRSRSPRLVHHQLSSWTLYLYQCFL